MTLAHRSISDVCLIVDDLERMMAFYRHSAGFALRRHAPGFADFATDGVTLALWERKHLAEHVGIYRKPGEAGHVMCAAQVESFAQVDALHQELASRNVTFLAEPRLYPWNAYACYFEDPENNLWEIYTWGEGGHAGLIKT